jgi:hypothetical protein
VPVVHELSVERAVETSVTSRVGAEPTIDTVLVAGEVVKRHGKLIGVDVDRVRAPAEESRDQVLDSAGVLRDTNWIPDSYQPN